MNDGGKGKVRYLVEGTLGYPTYLHCSTEYRGVSGVPTSENAMFCAIPEA